MKHVHDSISMKGLIIGIPFGLLMGFMFDNATLGLIFGVAFGITLNLTVFETKKISNRNFLGDQEHAPAVLDKKKK